MCRVVFSVSPMCQSMWARETDKPNRTCASLVQVEQFALVEDDVYRRMRYGQAIGTRHTGFGGRIPQVFQDEAKVLHGCWSNTERDRLNVDMEVATAAAPIDAACWRQGENELLSHCGCFLVSECEHKFYLD